MESMTNRMSQNGHTLDSDPQNRISQPRGRLGENLGSTQFTRSSSKTSKQKHGFKPAKRDSMDELDFLSQNSQRSDSWTDVVQGVTVVDGKLHQYDPKFPPGRDDVLKKMNFKKTKPSEDRKRSSSSQPLRDKSPNRVQPARTEAVQLPLKPKPNPRPIKRPSPSDPEELRSFNQLDIHSSPPEADLPQKPHPFPRLSPLSYQKQVRHCSSERQDGDPTKPNRAVKSKPSVIQSSESDSMYDSPKPRKSKKTERAKRSVTKGPNSTSSDDRLESKKIAAATYPIPSPLTPQDNDILSSSAVQAFPELSPLGSHDLKPFPLSPLASRSMRKGKGKAKDGPVEISDTDDGRTPKMRAQPFPMSTQFLEGIGSSPMATPKARSSHSKRLSDGSSDRGSKKHRGLDNSPKFKDADTTLSYLDSYADPSTLCPYCDQSLPRNPTTLLKRLLSVAATNSTKDPRPTNPLGRKAPFTNFISVCRRHHFETEILPEAEAKGWPKTIDWDQIEGRVKKMRKDLKALIDDQNVSSISDFEDEDEDLWSTGPRSRCVFWKEVMKDVKKKGSKVVAGVRSQFANFEKTQPGYYGELGSVIILQTLYNLFPPASFDPTSIKPLNPAEFIQRILVPEVGLRLIMEDNSLSGFSGAREALGILRESASYGVSMFPEDEGEWGVVEMAHNRKEKVIDGMRLGVADRMALDRARKRRKELEAEEAKEKAAETLESDASEVPQGSRTRKGQKKREVSNPPSQPPRPRPKPRPLKQPETVLINATSKPHPCAVEMDTEDDSHRADQRPITVSSDSEPASIAPRSKFAKSVSLDANLSSDSDCQPDCNYNITAREHREPRWMETPAPRSTDKPLEVARERARKRLEQRERSADTQWKKGYSWLLSDSSQSDC